MESLKGKLKNIVCLTFSFFSIGRAVAYGISSPFPAGETLFISPVFVLLFLALGLSVLIFRFMRTRVLKKNRPNGGHSGRQIGRRWFLGMNGNEKKGTNRQMMHLLDI